MEVDDTGNETKAIPKGNAVGLRASGLFLTTIGVVVAIAFFYPFAPTRGNRPSLWEHSSQSPHAWKVLVIGGCVGLVLAAIGIAMLTFRPSERQRNGGAQ